MKTESNMEKNRRLNRENPMPKSPPARSPLCACRVLLDNENVVCYEGTHTIIHCPFHKAAANLLPEMVRKLQDEHESHIVWEYGEQFFKHEKEPCHVCELISRAKEALGER